MIGYLSILGKEAADLSVSTPEYSLEVSMSFNAVGITATLEILNLNTGEIMGINHYRSYLYVKDHQTEFFDELGQQAEKLKTQFKEMLNA